jgi:hypothetical protein
MPSEKTVKEAIDSLIRKSRVHLYKPMQIAEILYRHRVEGRLNLNNLEEYRSPSKRWRDDVTNVLVGSASTSSSRFQDDIFSKTAISPEILAALGDINCASQGAVEAYIYTRFSERLSQFTTGISYCNDNTKEDFFLSDFLNLFWNTPGLKRSVDKVYEAIVYALFLSLIEVLEVQISVSYNTNKSLILKEFEDFAKNVVNLSMSNQIFTTSGSINRAGVANAADKGIDIWSNFGVIVQIKHLSLTEDLAEDIVGSVTADRIVIVCKSAEKNIIASLLTQIGWKARIQSIVTEVELINWYEKALRGTFSDQIGDKLISYLKLEIAREFPSSEKSTFLDFYKKRKYDEVPINPIWLPHGGDYATIV